MEPTGKRNQVVVMLEHGVKTAKQRASVAQKAAADAEAFNKELKASLARAQKEVDKAVGDQEGDYLKQYKIKHAELTFHDQIGHGQVCLPRGAARRGETNRKCLRTLRGAVID